MASGKHLPAGIDYAANIYFRQEHNGMLLGTDKLKSTRLKVSGAADGLWPRAAAIGPRAHF